VAIMSRAGGWRAAAAALLVAWSSAPALGRQPNLVLIVADDLGYSDLGSYGGEIATPVLDRLAFAGIRFTRFYATPRCSPTRAALLTGLWPHEAGVAHLNLDWGTPAYRGAIHDSVPTLPERLREQGYGTYMVGKWHLTPDLVPRPAGGDPETAGAGAPSSWPLQRGFDAYYGTLGGSGSYFDPPHLYDGNRPAPWPPAESRAADDAGKEPYLTDVLGERAATFVERHVAATPERPFFLYLAFTAPHWPLHAPAEDVERYRGRYDAGWDALRAERFRRLRELGLAPPDATVPPRDPGVADWSATADQEWQARRMEVYAAMVSAMDRAAGRVIAALEASSSLDDTVIVFLSDNGACGEEFRGLYTMAPFFIEIPSQTGDGREVRFGDRPDVVPGPADTFASYGRSWAHLANTPLRRYKHFTHEGGIAVPFFLHWPAGLGDRAGAIVDAPGHVVDLAATLLEIAREGGESGDDASRGRSLMPLLRGEPAEPRTLYWEHEGNRAIESGDWKLVSRWPFGWELYGLASDRYETADLASREPERVAELARAWNEWATAVGVESWPLVVPQVRTALMVVAGLLVVANAILRAGRARRRVPPPLPPPRETRPPSSPKMPKAGEPPAPIRPR
jgi:arylsulfatase